MKPMLFQSQRKKIEKYLDGKSSSPTAFDELLKDYLSGNLLQKLSVMGCSKTEIHIDWLDNYKCIGIQGKYQSFYVDIQIEEKHFSIAYDKDEPDEPQEYALEAAAQVYSVLENTVGNLA